MAESKATIPHFQVQTEVEMTAALAFREEIKAIVARSGEAPTDPRELAARQRLLRRRRVHPAWCRQRRYCGRGR